MGGLERRVSRAGRRLRQYETDTVVAGEARVLPLSMIRRRPLPDSAAGRPRCRTLLLCGRRVRFDQHPLAQAPSTAGKGSSPATPPGNCKGPAGAEAGRNRRDPFGATPNEPEPRPGMTRAIPLP